MKKLLMYAIISCSSFTAFASEIISQSKAGNLAAVQTAFNKGVTAQEAFDALIIAVVGHRKPIVEFLLENKVNPNNLYISGQLRETALSQAVRGDKADAKIVKMLLKAGADKVINKENSDGLTPLHIAAFEAPKAVTEILLKYDADPSIEGKVGNTRATALQIAEWQGNNEIAALLKEYKKTK